jgi:hypothetical protein
LFTAFCKCFNSDRENEAFVCFKLKILTQLMSLAFLESDWFIKCDELERGRYLLTCQ